MISILLRVKITDSQFGTLSGKTGTPATFLHTVTVENVHPKTTVALRVNGLSGDLTGLKLYAYNCDGKLAAVPDKLWSIHGINGKAKETDIVEIWIECEDGGEFDLSQAEKTVTVSALLANVKP